jgi:hypothetical protein
MPLHAYRHDTGWMFGRTFMAFTHMGRKTGQPHNAVTMVVHYETQPGKPSPDHVTLRAVTQIAPGELWVTATVQVDLA